MKKTFQTAFLRELIESEFTFVTTKTRKTGLNTVRSKINFNKHNQFHILDLFELNTSLKQLIRILFSFKYKKASLKSKKSINPRVYIYVWSSNVFILEFINRLSVSFSRGGLVVKTSIDFPAFDINQNFYTKKLLFVIGNPWLKHPSRVIDTKILSKRIFLVNELNFKSEKKNLGFYKIQNELDDYKKLVVILIIFQHILSFGEKTKKKI